MRSEEGGLSLELMDRAVDVWFPFPNADVAGKVARRQIIRTIDYDVVISNQLDSVVSGQSCRVGLNCDRWVDGKQTRARRIGFLVPNVVRSMQELPMKVAEVNRVLVDNSDCSNSGGGEVERRGRSEAAGPNTQHPGFFQSALTFLAHLSKIDLPRVPEELVGAEVQFKAGFIQGFFCHGTKYFSTVLILGSRSTDFQSTRQTAIPACF